MMIRQEKWSKERDKNKDGQWRKKPSNQGKKRKSSLCADLRRDPE